ncbi:MAG: hypothetical protein RML94_00260 [Bacteroidia bacterium]|nr:hypothetical protein [Bacteroidia bacterium]
MSLKSVIHSFFLGFSLLATFSAKNCSIAQGNQNEVLNTILQSVPSPVEISYLIKNVGVKYDKTLLNPTTNEVKYKTEYQKAANLGVYSTGLGYANIYEQNADAFAYLNAIKKLADGLNIGELINFSTISRLAVSSNNMNALLAETSATFERINTHLQENNKSDLAVLILVGGWLENLYLTTTIAKRTPNKELNNRIAEQKIILEQILQVVSPYENNPYMKSLSTDLKNLYKVFNTFKISVTENKIDSGNSKENGGILSVEGEAISGDIELSPKDLETILQQISAIRAKIIS